MNGKKSGKNPSRDDAGKKKGDSGASRKPLKKSTSARKSARSEEVEEDEDGDERPKKRGGSARGERAGGPPGKKGPDAGKLFLYFAPGLIIILLGAGIYLANLEPPKKTVIVDDPNKEIDKARANYAKAKNLYQDGAKIEGPGGIPKLKEALKLLEDGLAIIDEVREKLEKQQGGGTAADPGKPGVVMNNEFETLAPLMAQLKISTRKAILERE